jgi:D-proline reductase (dithiol) PrdB
VGVLARVLEAAGLATTAISLVRGQAAKSKAPRFLHCEFPLGRPLGKPADAAFQTDVLRRAFALLERTDVPVLVDHPDVIADESGQPASCVIPPRHDPALHPAVDEALALLPAYRRQVAAADGRTAVGRVVPPDRIGELVEAFVAIADGASLDDVGLDADGVRAAGQDVRAYYEEAGLALSDHVPAARQIETWFYQDTRTGSIVRRAVAQLEQAGVDRTTWYYTMPGTQI